jgi:cytochrome P450
MRDFEPTMTEQIEIFIKLLMTASQTSSAVNMTEYTKRLGMDIVGLLAFGYALNLQTDPKNRFMIRGIAVGTYQSNCFMQFPKLKALRLHHLLGIVGYKQWRGYRDILRQMVRSRLSEPTHAKHDLYSFVADYVGNSGEGLQIDELWSEALFFFPAGMLQSHHMRFPRTKTCFMDASLNAATE